MDCRNNRATKRGRCDDCRREYERERSARRRANATRARAIQVYHSKQWATLRKFVLDRDPICNACGERLSSQVDHILPMRHPVQPGRAPRNLYAVPSGKRAREAAQRARD
jgi:5-methylcytosine-specific restriction endonuclease McrA